MAASIRKSTDLQRSEVMGADAARAACYGCARMRRARGWCSVGRAGPLRRVAGALFASLLVGAGALAQPMTAPRSPRHFVDISEGLPEEPVTAIAIDPGDPEVMLAGFDGFLFKSDDGGGTWRPVLSFARGLSIDAEMALGESAASDLDYELDDRPLPTRVDPADAFDINAEIDLEDADDARELERLQDALDDTALLDDRPPRMSGDGDLSDGPGALPAGDADLRAIFPRQEAGVRVIRFAGPGSRVVYVGTARGLFRSVDNGETFSELELPGGALVNDVRDLAVDPLVPSRLYVATADGTLLSSDGAATFRRAPDLLGSTPALALVAKRVNDQDMVLLGTERGLWRSWDAGTTFREMLLQGVSAFEGVGALAFDERTGITYAGTLRGLFAAEREASLLEPRRAFFGEPVFAISIDPRRDRGVAVGIGERGVVESEDTGITVVDLPDALPARNAFGLARPGDEPDALVAGTERGVFRFVKGTGIRVTEDRLRDLVRTFNKEPSLRETAEAALRYARLDGRFLDVTERARFAPLLPELRVRFRYKAGRPDVEEYVVAVEDPDAFDETDAEEIIDLARDGILIDAPSRGITWDIFALATWNLDEVIYNPVEAQAARQLPTLFLARDRVLKRVESLYTSRRRLMAEIYLDDKPQRPSEQARKQLRLAELTALLSGLTGGAFVELAEARGATFPELHGSVVVPDGERSASLPNPRRR